MRKRVHSTKPVTTETITSDLKDRKLYKLPPKKEAEEEYKLTKEDALSYYRGVIELYKSQDKHVISIGREKELAEISQFLETNIAAD